MKQYTKHVDHVVWAVRPENQIGYVRRFSELMRTSFSGPFERADIGIRAYVSWECGVEFVSPINEKARSLKYIEQYGETFYAVVFGVSDITAKAERADRLGYPASQLLRATGAEPWPHLVSELTEAYIGDICNTLMLFGQIVYRKGVLKGAEQAPAHSGFTPFRHNDRHVDHVVWVVKPERFETYIQQFSTLFETEFCPAYDRPDLGIRVAVSWEAGLEFVTPISHHSLFRDRLERCGEGVAAVVIGTTDIEAETHRVLSLGHPVGDIVWPTGNEPWLDQIEQLQEVKIGELCGTMLVLGQIGYKPRITPASIIR